MFAVVKVLLCSDCRVGEDKAGSLEVTTLPEPGSILLEQWTVSVLPQASREPNGMDALSLLQAVRFDPFFFDPGHLYNLPHSILLSANMSVTPTVRFASIGHLWRSIQRIAVVHISFL